MVWQSIKYLIANTLVTVLTTNWLMMITWLGNVNRYMLRAMYRNCQNVPVQIVLLLLVHKFVMVQWQLWIIPKIMFCVRQCFFYRKITFLSRDCSASLMFATRGLPTCKMLIRKHANISMKSAAESRNVILHSIVRNDSLFTSPLWQHWRNVLYVGLHPF